MTATIAYDKPVKNLIDALSATGHVTHTKYKKKSVTFHHNGGRLSHEGVLAVWKYRPASAHFDSDAFGRIAQYVEVHEYAWAVANTRGNQETISIEMCNSSLSPNWEVADPTWHEAARLAGWLFVHVIGERPTSANVFFHHHWYRTSCAGPYMDKIYNKLLAAVQAAYDHFRGQTPAPTPHPTASPVVLMQQALEVPADGKWGNGTDQRALLMRNAARARAGYPNNTGVMNNTTTVQNVVNTTQDGVWGPRSQSALVAWIEKVQGILGIARDGKWGPGTDGKFLEFRKQHLNKF